MKTSYRIIKIIGWVFLAIIVLGLVAHIALGYIHRNIEFGDMTHTSQEACEQLDSICMLAENQEVTFTSNTDGVSFSISERDMTHGSFSYTLGDNECFDLQVDGARIISVTNMSMDRFPQDRAEFLWMNNTASIPAHTPDGRDTTVSLIELLVDNQQNIVFTLYIYRTDIPSP